MTFIFWLISLLPLRVLHAIGGALGLLAARLPGRYGQRLTENFRHAYPDVTDAMLAEAARATGRLILEMPYFWSRKTLDAALYNFDDSLWPTLNRLQMQANGIIILTPHLGCFEVLPQSHAVHRPVTVLFKPPHQQWLRDFVERMRSRPGISMAPATPRGVRMLVKALKRGEAVGILPDQVPSAGDGAWAPFFGKPAYSMTLVHRLHRLTNAPVVMMFAERLPKGAGYVGHMRLVGCGGVLAAEVEAAAAQINRAVEESIAMVPTQYLWGYNRYKQPTGAPPPPDLTSQPQAAPQDIIQ
ncbi:KDO2-lipid IV(A) lauroyltransferase [Cupriavidus sp. OV038]|jgi:KDO2-lipid IV(A) lauroyltransferase|uniref:lysophospholipid acyltransferase family protein n=1 Tax=unclassified Cupriavidus TaxID=2640874 RepID=UPI0008F45386|nr:MULTISPECIES: lysophospholipid acyltransferase family protein [unclassified Cupriavidus]SFC73610.1 KDO2-lipid IV(A) lauroyltransferase [Cupriavidus sp. OV038]SFO75681.1 KDO2-lipid IV(A) lauroyltransferase [Cupriavidus sp. OV096]